MTIKVVVLMHGLLKKYVHVFLTQRLTFYNCIILDVLRNCEKTASKT